MDTFSYLLIVLAGAAAWTGFITWRVRVSDPDKAYQPERYYMRGPGPKWRQKHASGRVAGSR
jgi:hypothetical protein